MTASELGGIAELVADAKERGYAGPLERLDELGALVPGSMRNVSLPAPASASNSDRN